MFDCFEVSSFCHELSGDLTSYFTLDIHKSMHMRHLLTIINWNCRSNRQLRWVNICTDGIDVLFHSRHVLSKPRIAGDEIRFLLAK